MRRNKFHLKKPKTKNPNNENQKLKTKSQRHKIERPTREGREAEKEM